MKKIIGIIGGMGPLATADLFEKIIRATDAAKSATESVKKATEKATENVKKATSRRKRPDGGRLAMGH